MLNPIQKKKMNNKKEINLIEGEKYIFSFTTAYGNVCESMGWYCGTNGHNEHVWNVGISNTGKDFKISVIEEKRLVKAILKIQ